MPFRNLLTCPPSLPLVAPSILAADFADLGTACRASIDAGADLLHLDVMDGHFVPNLTMGPALCRSLRRALPETFLDVHLMVRDPAAFVEPFADAGADHLTFHVEVEGDHAALADRIRAAGPSAGLALSPATPVEAVHPHLAAFDLLLVMSVNPGFAGQSFIASVLEKTADLAPRLRPDQRLQMDGGIAPANAAACREAGCDVLVAASAIFGEGIDMAAAVTALRGAAAGAGVRARGRRPEAGKHMAGRRDHIMVDLIRCGETAWEQDGRLHGVTDLPLSTAGRVAVTEDAARRRSAVPATIYHPPDEAAAETARIFGRVASARLREREGLGEPDLGLLEGLLVQQVAERYPRRHKQWEEDPLSLAPPEGEPLAEARARLLAATSRILRKSRATEVAMVLHPLAFGFLHCWLSDRPASDVWRVLRLGRRYERFMVATAILDRLREAARAETAET